MSSRREEASFSRLAPASSRRFPYGGAGVDHASCRPSRVGTARSPGGQSKGFVRATLRAVGSQGDLLLDRLLHTRDDGNRARTSTHRRCLRGLCVPWCTIHGPVCPAHREHRHARGGGGGGDRPWYVQHVRRDRPCSSAALDKQRRARETVNPGVHRDLVRGRTPCGPGIKTADSFEILDTFPPFGSSLDYCRCARLALPTAALVLPREA